MKELRPTTADIEACRKLDATRSRGGSDPRNVALEVASAFIGVREIGTTNKGYWINKFHQDVGLAPGYPWCVMFIQYVYRVTSEIVGLNDILPYNTASTQALANWAEKYSLTVDKLTDAKSCDLLIWRNGSGATGHVGMITSVKETKDGIEIQTIEGNTSAAKYRDGGLVAVKSYTYEGDELGDARKTGRWLRSVVSFDRLVDGYGRTGMHST